jgi:hypothetical protein
MIIYTGYFGGIKKYDYPNPISIALSTPDWFKGPKAEYLAPKKEWFFKWKNIFDEYKICKTIRTIWMPHDHCDDLDIEIAQDPCRWYVNKFYETVIANESPEVLYSKLIKTAQDAGYDVDEDHGEVTLLCYEKKLEPTLPLDTFCHRNIVSIFFKDATYDSVGECTKPREWVDFIPGVTGPTTEQFHKAVEATIKDLPRLLDDGDPEKLWTKEEFENNFPDLVEK